MIGFVIAVIAPLNVTAQDASAVIDASTKAMGTAMLQSIRYTGTGTNNSVGQAFTSGGPWPRYKVTKYAALVNYSVPTMRQEIVRIDNEFPPRGGGAGGFNPAAQERYDVFRGTVIASSGVCTGCSMWRVWDWV